MWAEGKGMRLWTYSPSPVAGYIETVTNNLNWWSYVHGRPQADTDQFRDGAEQNDDLTMLAFRITNKLTEGLTLCEHNLITNAWLDT